MGALADKFRRALEGRVTVAGFTFIFRRPTWEEAQRIPGGASAEKLLSHVVGWVNVREIDLVPGGDPHPAEFDPDACRLWLCDRPDLSGPVGQAILDAYAAHVTKLGESLKNSAPGSTASSSPSIQASPPTTPAPPSAPGT